ncbi:MAG: DUF1961 family protein [Cellulosilyticaceae bacterium]
MNYKYQKGEVIYQNKLSSVEDVKRFKMEGDGIISFPMERMRMESTRSIEDGQKANIVYWVPEDFPDNISIEWDFYPIREPGLCIVFFSAKGKNGKDLFDESLNPRTGEYNLYFGGDINTYHLSYFRRRYEEERSFHTCNLRKSFGGYMVAQGADPIPSIMDIKAPYHIELVKYRNKITFYINDLCVLDWTDDNETYGEVLGEGKIGFRQMAPLIAEYANLKISKILGVIED